MDVLIRKEAIGDALGVYLATINNWIKTQFIPSPDIEHYYSEVSYNYIMNKLKNDPHRLNSRANRTLQRKKEICCLGITDKTRKNLLCNLVDDFEKSDLSLDDGVLALALSILRFNNLINDHCNNNSKIEALLSKWIEKSDKPELVRQLYSRYEIQNLDDDILGAFYQSIQNVSQKSSNGSYYTPTTLLKEIKISPNKTILDPCCGSGGILLNVITKKHKPENIYAQDIDETALKICFINLALFFNDNNIMVNISKQDITKSNADFLFSDSNNKQFDYVITNPSWGSKFSKKEKEYFLASYPGLENYGNF